MHPGDPGATPVAPPKEGPGRRGHHFVPSQSCVCVSPAGELHVGLFPVLRASAHEVWGYHCALLRVGERRMSHGHQTWGPLQKYCSRLLRFF